MRGIMGRQSGRVRRGWRRLIVEGGNSFLVQRMRNINCTVIKALDRNDCGVSDITNLTHGMMMTLPNAAGHLCTFSSASDRKIQFNMFLFICKNCNLMEPGQSTTAFAVARVCIVAYLVSGDMRLGGYVTLVLTPTHIVT
jgi:hypothetical protein